MKNHAIHSLIFEMALPTQAAAIAVQNRLSTLAERVVPELLEAAIAPYDRPNTVTCLDRLELDLGEIALESLESDLREKLSEQLTEQLAKQCWPSSPSRAGIPPSFSLTQSADLPSGPPLQPSADIACFPYSLTLLNQFQQFLITGTLPWNADLNSFRNLDRLALTLLDQEKNSLAHVLQQVANIPEARQRLILNLSVETLKQLLTEYRDGEGSEIDDLQSAIAWLVQQLQPSTIQRSEKLLVVGTFLRWLFEPSTSSDLLFEQWLNQALRLDRFASPEAFVTFQQRVAQALPQAAWVVQRPAWGTQLMQHLAEIVTQLSTESMPPDRPGDSPALDSPPLLKTADIPPEINPLPLPFSEIGVSKTAPQSTEAATDSSAWGQFGADASPFHSAPTETAWFVQNSGLVLLYPYFKRYLATLGLLQDGQFISSDHQMQAVHALEVLVRGQTSYREYDLVLNKVLCGLPLPTPIDPEWTTPPAIAVEAEQLLQNAIRNWTIIKNTSVDGFRRSFLMRDGKLIWRETSWTLILDRKGYDVLLEYLPYPIYVVKSPWINRPLYVEW